MLKLEQLNRQQQQAVKHREGPLLVVAGAGTGKTQVITYRVAYLIERLKVKPNEILAVTFTDKAAREMESRVSDLLGKYVLDVNITTFNAFGNNLLKRFAYDLGLSPELTVMNQIQQVVFLRQHLDSLDLNYYAPVTGPEAMLGELARYFSKLKNELITPAQYTKFARALERSANSDPQQLEAERHRELATVYQRYQQLSRQAGVIDYDDQLYLAVELLERRTNIRRKLQAEISYVLVDEFQDTNRAQSVLVDLLVGRRKDIVVVGDDDQSIYKFRGAALSNILDFKQRYPRARQLPLLQNYRSTQAILDSAYQLIQHNNPDRLEAKYGLNKRLVGRQRGQPPQLQSFVTREEEAAWISRDIKARLKAGQSAAEVAVLLRKNSQAQWLLKYLEAEAIDYVVIGQTEDLYQQPAVKLLLHFLRVVTDPADSESLYHLLVSSVYRLPAGELRPLVAAAKRKHLPLEQLLPEAAELPAKTARQIEQFSEQLAGWRELLPQVSVGQLCYRWLDDSGYLHRLIKQAKSEPALDQNLNQLNQFFTTLIDYERIASDQTAVGYINNLPSLLGTGERLALEDLPDLYGQKVRILTVHRAKGLEFEVVYLFDMTQDTFPSRPQPSSLEVPAALSPEPATLGANPQLQEERRLMYVAMTRAKRELILTYSIDHGGARPRKPSIFIGEALGEYPLLADLPKPTAVTAQIELFKGKTPAKAEAGSELPLTFFDGQTLVLSAHQIEDYLMCPAEFKLRYLIGPPQPVSFALEYGNLMHSLIQFYNRQRLEGRQVKLPELLQWLKDNWPAEGFLTPGHQARSLRQAQATLRRFYSRQQKSRRYPRYIERAFSCELPEFDVTVKGRFDAVYQDEDGVEIRDYKTGAARVTDQAKADQRTKTSLQLGIYALAWQRLQGVTPDSLSLDFIDSGWVGTAVKTERQLQTVLKKVEQAAAGIRAGDFRPGSSHLFCTHMEYGF